ncbi:retrovirus-related pol polyprotein from transposon TNT 1-94 [Tanacetum coccineum]
MEEDGYSLVENVTYNVFKEKAMHSLIKALFNEYDDKQRSLQRLCYYYLRSPRVFQAVLQQLVVRVELRIETEAELYDRGQEVEQKYVEIIEDRRDKDKEVNTAARDFGNALVCCVKNTVKDHIIDFGASFHATYYKEELERFKLRSGKVHLAYDKTLDIAGIRDVVLKTSFGKSWTLKDVRYIPGLKRRLISVRQLDEEGYHVGFEDQQWNVTKGSLVVAHVNKRGILYMVEVHPERIGAFIDGSGNATLWFGEAKEGFLHNVIKDKETAKAAVGFAVETPLQFGVAKRLSRTFRAESTGLRAEAPKMLWANLVSIAYLIYRIPYVLIGLRIPEEEWQGKDTSLAHLKAAAQMKCDTAFRIRRFTRLSEAEILHLWTRFMEPEHWLSLEITQSPGESLNTSEGSEYSRSFEDSERSDEEVSKDRASFEEEGLETPQWKKAINEEMVSLEKNRTCSLVRLPARKKASQSLWMFKVKEEQNSKKSCEDNYNQLAGQKEKPRVQIEGNSVRTDSSTEAMPCIDVHQIGDEREVEVMRSFNWPPSELITEDGVLPEREVQSCILLDTNKGWMYIACLNCNKIVPPIIKESAYHDRGYPIFECLECSANFKCVAPRYRVKFTVVDEQTKTFTYLILFDREVTQIVGKSAFSLYDLFTNIQDKIPHELYDMVGKQ